MKLLPCIALAVLALAAPAAAAPFSAPQPLGSLVNDYGITLAFDAPGTLWAVHSVPYSSGRGITLASRAPGAAALTAPLQLANPKLAQIQTASDVAGDGAVGVGWWENRTRERRGIRVVVREPDGRLITRHTVSRTDSHGVRNVDVAVDARGDAIAVWTAGVYRSRDRGSIEYAYRPAGGSWTRAAKLVDNGAEYAQVDMADDGSAVATWLRADGVETAAITRGVAGSVRRFSLGKRLARPAVSVAPDGGAVIAWEGLPDSATPDDDGVLRGDEIAIAATRAPGTGAFSPAQTLGASDTSHHRFTLQLFAPLAGAGGRLQVAWAVQDYTDDHTKGENGILSEVRSWDGHATSTLQEEVQGFAVASASAFAPAGDALSAFATYLDATHSGIQIAGQQLGGPLQQPYAFSQVIPALWVGPDGRAELAWGQRGSDEGTIDLFTAERPAAT